MRRGVRRIGTAAWWVAVLVPVVTIAASGWAVYGDLREVHARPASSTTTTGTSKVWRTSNGYSEFGDDAVERTPAYALVKSVRKVEYFAKDGDLARIDVSIQYDALTALDQQGRPTHDLARADADPIVLAVVRDQMSRAYDHNIPASEVPPRFIAGTEVLWRGTRRIAWRAARPSLLSGAWVEGVLLLVCFGFRALSGRDPGLCPECSYPRVTGAGRCPECGGSYGAPEVGGPAQTP